MRIHVYSVKVGLEEQYKDREIMGLLYGEIRLSISI